MGGVYCTSRDVAIVGMCVLYYCMYRCGVAEVVFRSKHRSLYRRNRSESDPIVPYFLVLVQTAGTFH